MYRTGRRFGKIIHRIWQLTDFRRKGKRMVVPLPEYKDQEKLLRELREQKT